MSALASANSIAAEIKTLLESCKQRLFDEIRRYPTPIAGCDQQFNYLLEQQATIARELAQTLVTIAEAQTHRDPRGLLGELIRTAHSLDDTTRQRLLSRLHE